MKKRIFPICLSFLISAAYVASRHLLCIVRHKESRAELCNAVDTAGGFSAADYAVLGVLLCRNKADKIAVTVIAAIAFFFAIGPACVYTDVVYVFSYVSLSFEIFLLFFAPILLCAFPFVLAGIQISKSSRIKNI